ncbi:hypothetical protein ABZO31_04205 [Streptomyces sp. HUAS MG47]|uniref:hypothetical protein n=1 Tax=Streptomyces solicamelliae TaxID=3231716 RepID=UPI003877A963
MTDEWTATKQKYPVGSSLKGTVTRVAPFGIFVSAEGTRPSGVVADLAGMHKDPADDSVVIRPEVGDPVTGVVVEHSEHNEQLKIHLT